ncbi:MAG: hypothetical protein BroJett018_15560 [Chloroflexota bacterium]|nr:MAG: hypothetical protein BroJett018_15560 [Chloroflexota bacterium]
MLLTDLVICNKLAGFSQNLNTFSIILNDSLTDSPFYRDIVRKIIEISTPLFRVLKMS